MEITKRKKDVLKLLVKGKRAKDIAKELLLTEGTVRLHIRDLKLFFHANTTPELISKSIKEGIINV